MLSDEKLVEETWDEFPHARSRLLKLIALASLHTTVVLISGDIHRSEISTATNRLIITHLDDPVLASLHLDASVVKALQLAVSTPIQLVEFTSSGLSHTFTKVVSALVDTTRDDDDHPSRRLSDNSTDDAASTSRASRDNSIVVEVHDRGWPCTLVDYLYQVKKQVF